MCWPYTPASPPPQRASPGASLAPRGWPTRPDERPVRASPVSARRLQIRHLYAPASASPARVATLDDHTDRRESVCRVVTPRLAWIAFAVVRRAGSAHRARARAPGRVGPRVLTTRR